ncbi:amino acid permease, partial [Pirellulaceae bacterium]|nr:amino acid permease [Pirellulaceae bacterium]
PLETGDFGVAFCKSLMWISLSYMGFNAAVYVAEEAGDAKSKIPKALLTGTLIVVVLYVLLNAVFVYSADASKVAESGPAVAAFAAQQLGGASFAVFFQVIISIALFTSVTSMMMAAPRVYAKMADDGMLPAIFSFQKNAPPILDATSSCIGRGDHLLVNARVIVGLFGDHAVNLRRRIGQQFVFTKISKWRVGILA